MTTDTPATPGPDDDPYGDDPYGPEWESVGGYHGELLPDPPTAVPAAVPEALPAEALAKLLTTVAAETLVRKVGDSKWYTYVPDGREFISVTTVLGATCSKPWLADWAAKLAAEYAASNLDGLMHLRNGGTSSAGLTGAIKGEAKRMRDARRDAGSHAHHVIEALGLWAADGRGADIALPLLPDELAATDLDGVTLAEFVEACVDGFLNFITDFDVTIEMSEAPVFHPGMEYAGTADLVCWLGRHQVRLLTDAKTGTNLDETVPAQLAAYRRAQHVAVDEMGTMVGMPRVDGTAVLHLRPEFPRGYRLRVMSAAEDAEGWNNFRSALNLYHGYERQGPRIGTVWSPLGADGVPLPMLLGDLEGYGAGIGALLRETTCTTIADVAEMTREQCLAVKGVGPKTIEGIERALGESNMTFTAALVTAVA